MVYIIFLIVVLGAVFLIIAYNRLVQLKNLMQEAWSSIDVLLKKRYDLLPNLVEIVKGYTQHEKAVLEKITEYRSKALSAKSQEEKMAAEQQLQNAMLNLNAVAENYPELKANQNFLELQRQLADIENTIEPARRYYNGTVRDLNTNIQSFPNNLIANAFGFSPAKFFELENPSLERTVPQIKF